ncbi:MAG: HPr(Ser) kinase/phosphatase [Clostridia bacterium]|nr:HPr(Ser) kinase/phosphatase [Clostridia bacterium]
MKSQFSVSLARIVEEFSLKPISVNGDPAEIMISSADVNRPGLQFSGYYEYYDNDRIQIVGKSEVSFLETLSKDEYEERISKFLSTKPPLVVIARGIEPSEFFVNQANINNVPLYQTSESTSDFMSALIAFLNVQLAPRITRHGVLVDVYGEGILILGESGVGKSEAAIELVKRGHRMIADDAVEIRRVSSRSLVGSAPENIRHFIELRGIGVINISRIFGVGAVKPTEKIDMVIKLEQWDSNKAYDRMGLEDETTEILGLNITSITIPIKPGRNLAVIIEVAAMNNRQKKMGYNAANELLKKLGMATDIIPERTSTNIDDVYK